MATPIQLYYVPLREADLIDDFEAIGTSSVDENGFIRSLISIAVAAPGTTIWYDHWEDGYEVSYGDTVGQSSTAIWGDGNMSNDGLLSLDGFINGIPMNDIFEGGESIILENAVDLPRLDTEFRFDGADRIVVSFPVAVTRAAYPTNTGEPSGGPGSLLAGAVEVFATDSYGTEFVLPIGEDTTTAGYTDAFSLTNAHVMASQATTEVFLNGVSQGTIAAAGGTLVVENLDEGDRITTDAPVQVTLVTGDDPSGFEMRWYALAPRDQWSNDYVAPFAEEEGSTGFWFFNPGNEPDHHKLRLRG